ncbi:hypothetical protein C5Z25_02490 [Lactobacillus sp. CBA3605]|uniref:hypothetical protein n=1 Tax=Lactobacillus sp. CBA3605 TaxID=2099788 RepID=UPI000CFB5180|nr:hypothetical protein [Lactobacillus sp. CBA3605]AVK60685.1 hypothetical protein C5Z25_02490 [Lactobacillus sp. CBA3605]
MTKQVAATIINMDTTGTSFLVQQQKNQYRFYHLTVLTGQSPLASVLSELRNGVGIDVNQLRLYDSVTAEVDGEKIALFVFNHLQVNADVRQSFANSGLNFVSASQLHGLFTSVKVDMTPAFEKLSK